MANAPKQNPQLRIAIFFLVIIGIAMLFHRMAPPQDPPSKITFSEFMADLELPAESTNRVTELTIKEQEITGKRQDASTFMTYGPVDSDLSKELLSRGIKINYEPPDNPSLWRTLLVNSLPILLLIVLFIFFMRQLQIGGGKAMSFGKSRAKLLTESQTKVTFADVAGIDEAKQELEEIIEFLRDPKKFTRLGGRIPKGVLLVGPPGTGKTILAKAVAGEAGVPFFSISGSDFVEMFVGVGASRVRDLFEQAKKHAPCIVFIDEIDAVGRHRGAGLGGGHDEREQTLNQLLVEMDGFESNEGVILIAATNRSDVLDPALLRPGRFDRRVIVPKPDLKGREGILGVHIKKTPTSDDVKVKTLAQGTPGFSGADLENLVNEAALIAARTNKDRVGMHEFELAKDKVLMGPERKSMILGEKEKRTTAYHEAGHAIVALKVEGADPVHKISIIPRGQALGVTVLLPDEDRFTLSKQQAEGIIAYAMGGRAAEELIFERFTTGAGDDIQKATDIARKMVCHWGMSERIGPLALGKQQEEVFLGREMSAAKPYSEKLAQDIDEEVRKIVQSAYERALSILRENRVVLEGMAEALLVKEVLDKAEIARILKGEDIITEEDRRTYDDVQRKRREDLEKPVVGDSKKATDGEEKSVDSSSTLNPLPQGT